LWGKVSWLRETTRWQGLGLESLALRSEAQHPNHYKTMPPQKILSEFLKEVIRQIANLKWPQRNLNQLEMCALVFSQPSAELL